MSDLLQNEENLGAVLLQVQDDLRRLKNSLEKITRGQALDVQALDAAILRTECSIRKHAEDYLKSVNKQLLVLPSIEDLQKKTSQVPRWKPALESVPEVHPQREDVPGASPGEKHKSAVTMRLLCNPSHPNTRAIMHQKFGISLPDVHRRETNAVKHHRLITGPVMSLQAVEQKGRHREEETRTVPDASLIGLSIKVKAASLNHRQDSYSSKTGLIGSKSRCLKKLDTEPGSTREGMDRECSPLWTTKTPPPSTNTKSCQNLTVETSKYPFTISKGRVDPLAADFCHFRQSFAWCWSSVADALEPLEKLLADFAVPRARVSGERLVELCRFGWKQAPPVNGLLSVFENWEEVWGLVSRPGQRYKGEGGTEAAAVLIQSCCRRYLARTAYLRHCRRKWAARTIATAWSMHTELCGVKKALQARRVRQLENHRSRAQHLAANWKQIQSSKRTIIHIPSLGYSEKQRLNLRRFDILQNVQISRLCDIRDENVEVIYVCPQRLGEDVLHYFSSLLRSDADGADPSVRRFVILTPEAVDYFPTHNMCLSTLLKYSPRTLKRIRNLIQGKQTYIVGGVAHVDDLAVADELGVPVLAPEPAVAQLYSTKSGGRRVFAGAEVQVPPGRGDIYSLNQLHEVLAELLTLNMDVQRWLFKMDSEHGGRGTAYCDVCHLPERRGRGPELWKSEGIQERCLDGIPEWLARYARPAQTSCYANWALFLKTFLRQGGVVEAYPPSDSVTCLTVDLLLEPGGGEVTVLSCGDQLHGSCRLETAGSTVPQSSVRPETLHAVCMRVGRACLQRHIVGHVSVDLATFLDHNTMEQKVWAIDLDLAYSDQLALTQMLLMTTGGTMNCRAGCLEVPFREESCDQQIAAKPPGAPRYAVLGSRLFHSNLSMLYHHVFLRMCRTHGIGFNMKRKRGTLFSLYDGEERCSIGMITVSEDLRGALVTFARNLSVIHQEISASRMQGETNFKELIKDVEDVVQLTARNKTQALEEQPAA